MEETGPEGDGSGRAALVSYERVSEDSRVGDAHAVRNQHRINVLTARAHGHEVTAHYTDNGLSAAKVGCVRPAFDRLLADLKEGVTSYGVRIAGVVCVADDRLYRHAVDFARFLEAFTSRDGRVFVNQTGVRDLYSQQGLAAAVQALEIATAETAARGQRVSNWHWSRAMDGAPHSGPRPFGWLDDRRTLHVTEAERVGAAIRDRISGRSVGEIAREWRAIGITGTRGGTPKPQTVTQIITAPRVCGYRSNRGELLLDPHTGAPVVGQWDVIASSAEWRAVCATFSDGSLFMHRGSGTPRLTDVRTGPRYLASGFLRCGGEFPDGATCGTRMGGGKSSGSKRSPYRYTCTGDRGCGRCSISGPLVDDAIERLLFPETRDGRVRLPESLCRRWLTGELGLDEKRKVVASVFDHLVVAPGEKGNHTWDYSRLSPVWRWAGRVVA
ncbi:MULTISPECIES: recombinase family protein [unclassified Streptomyces]|uniref:recombinase family protein n=1 Tax=unclassified Streptomyces TaxID=2593676 RepID=UPI002E1911C2